MPLQDADGGFSRWQQQGAKKARRESAAPHAIAGRSEVPRDPSRTVVVRNVPWSASEQDLYTFFGQSGEVGAWSCVQGCAGACRVARQDPGRRARVQSCIWTVAPCPRWCRDKGRRRDRSTGAGLRTPWTHRLDQLVR